MYKYCNIFRKKPMKINAVKYSIYRKRNNFNLLEIHSLTRILVFLIFI